MEVLQGMNRMDRRIGEIQKLKNIINNKLNKNLNDDVDSYMRQLVDLYFKSQKSKGKHLGSKKGKGNSKIRSVSSKSGKKINIGKGIEKMQHYENNDHNNYNDNNNNDNNNNNNDNYYNNNNNNNNNYYHNNSKQSFSQKNSSENYDNGSGSDGEEKKKNYSNGEYENNTHKKKKKKKKGNKKNKNKNKNSDKSETNDEEDVSVKMEEKENMIKEQTSKQENEKLFEQENEKLFEQENEKLFEQENDILVEQENDILVEQENDKLVEQENYKLVEQENYKLVEQENYKNKDEPNTSNYVNMEKVIDKEKSPPEEKAKNSETESNIEEQNNADSLDERKEKNMKSAIRFMKESNYEDPHLNACLSDSNIDGMNINQNEDELKVKDILSNPFTTSSYNEENEKMSNIEIHSNKINNISNCIQKKKTQINLNNVLKELKFKSANNIRYPRDNNSDNITEKYINDGSDDLETYKKNSSINDDEPDHYTSFVKHYVTKVAIYNNMEKNKFNLNTSSQSFGINHIYNMNKNSYNNNNNSFQYNKSYSSTTNEEQEKEKREYAFNKYMNYPNINCSNINQSYSNMIRNYNERVNDQNINCTNPKIDCLSQSFSKIKKMNLCNSAYYPPCTYGNTLKSIKKYSCTNTKDYINEYNCAKNPTSIIPDISCFNGIDIMKNHINIDNIKKHVNLENVKKNIDLKNVKKLLNLENITNKINFENVKERVNIKNVTDHINIESISKNVECFDNNYYDIFEEAYQNYINKYVNNVKKTIKEKKEYYTKSVDCNYDLINKNLLKVAANNINNLNNIYLKNKSKLQVLNTKKYIAFNHNRYLRFLNSCYEKRINSVKKRIELNKKFLNNYFHACYFECSENTMLSNDLLSRESSSPDYLNSNEQYHQKQSSMTNSINSKSNINHNSGSHELFNRTKKNDPKDSQQINKNLSSFNSNKEFNSNSEIDISCFNNSEKTFKYMKGIFEDSGGAENDIIYDEEKNMYFDLNDNAYINVKGNLYFNTKDKLFYDIEYIKDISYDHVKNNLFQFGNYLITEKYAPCKIIMKMCSHINQFMYNLLGVSKYDIYYKHKDNLVEIIIK
ncbi:conserved Plasmodium protein, unknown function [Plasmodium sp. DRC-Itaito]|nr:conserved Plasmodium protein, unknown function [Plasmodium sp. DRC-Itaito]